MSHIVSPKNNLSDLPDLKTISTPHHHHFQIRFVDEDKRPGHFILKQLDRRPLRCQQRDHVQLYSLIRLVVQLFRITVCYPRDRFKRINPSASKTDIKFTYFTHNLHVSPNHLHFGLQKTKKCASDSFSLRKSIFWQGGGGGEGR